jgi:hypothetical protein
MAGNVIIVSINLVQYLVFYAYFPVCLINVQECPLALEAAEGLLSLGVKGIEVNALVLEGASNFGNMDW